MTRPRTTARIHVGAVSEFADGDRRLIEHENRIIGVFRIDDEFRAYDNNCLHQGGPVCEGRYFPRMRAVTTPDGRVTGEMHDESEPHLVCPWHGWEYDLRTGEFCGDRRRRLRSYDVQVEEGQIYVIAG